MADLDYSKFNWTVPSAKERRESTIKAPTGIGAKPADEQEPMDKGFYESMYDAIVTYFDDAEEADRVLKEAKPDRDAIRSMTLSEFDDLTLRSAEEAGVLRQDMGKTEAAVPEERKETRLVDVTDTELGRLDNVKPLEELAEDIDPGTINTSELRGKGLMSPRLDSKGETPETARIGDVNFSPIEESIKEKTSQFYLDIGQKAETDHGSVPKATNDTAEKDLPEAQRSKDVGFGHQVKSSEEASGEIHGIKFKNEDGTYIELTEAQKVEILNKDMSAELALARSGYDGKEGWDAKLKKLGITWDELDYKYQNALTSLAYNVGGAKAGTGWTKVLQAAKDGNVKEFAKQMRRKDSGKNTAGMDNRVAKELYYAGIISGLDDVSSVLPLADSKVSGVPQSGDS